MGVIKLGFISLVVFALLITGISFFFPAHIRISKAIDINANKDSVLNQIKNAAHWKNWYPGADTMALLVEDGQAVGLQLDSLRGAIRITNITDSSVTAAIVGQGLRKATTGWNSYQSAAPNTITVQWYMDFHLRWYPWEKFSSLLFEKRYGPLMEKGLDNLKKMMEK
ncbi:MAG: SRPBCC family protein [Chitinophagaceae bacterium]